jgi:hypothetical protein
MKLNAESFECHEEFCLLGRNAVSSNETLHSQRSENLKSNILNATS